MNIVLWGEIELERSSELFISPSQQVAELGIKFGALWYQRVDSKSSSF